MQLYVWLRQPLVLEWVQRRSIWLIIQHFMTSNLRSLVQKHTDVLLLHTHTHTISFYFLFWFSELALGFSLFQTSRRPSRVKAANHSYLVYAKKSCHFSVVPRTGMLYFQLPGLFLFSEAQSAKRIICEYSPQGISLTWVFWPLGFPIFPWILLCKKVSTCYSRWLNVGTKVAVRKELRRFCAVRVFGPRGMLNLKTYTAEEVRPSHVIPLLGCCGRLRLKMCPHGTWARKCGNQCTPCNAPLPDHRPLTCRVLGRFY